MKVTEINCNNDVQLDWIYIKNVGIEENYFIVYFQDFYVMSTLRLHTNL